MGQSLKEELAESFAWFIELGFEIVVHSYEPASFGNSTLILRSPDLGVRFARDRGLTEVEVSSPRSPNEWWWPQYVLDGGTFRRGDWTLGSAVREVHANLPALIQALGTDYIDTVERVDKRRAEPMRRFLQTEPAAEPRPNWFAKWFRLP